MEDTVRGRAVLSSLQANKQQDQAALHARLSRTFGLDPALQAGMETEGEGQIDQNTGLAWGQAGAGIYESAASDYTNALQFKEGLNLAGADDAAKLYMSSYYDAARKGGLLNQMMQTGGQVASSAIMAGAMA